MNLRPDNLDAEIEEAFADLANDPLTIAAQITNIKDAIDGLDRDIANRQAQRRELDERLAGLKVRMIGAMA